MNHMSGAYRVLLLGFIVMAVHGCVTYSPIQSENGCMLVNWRGAEDDFSVRESHVRDISVMREWFSTMYYGINIKVPENLSVDADNIRGLQISHIRYPMETRSCSLPEHLEHPYCMWTPEELVGTRSAISFSYAGTVREAKIALEKVDDFIVHNVLRCDGQ